MSDIVNADTENSALFQGGLHETLLTSGFSKTQDINVSCKSN